MLNAKEKEKISTPCYIIDEEKLKNMSNEEVNQYVQDMCKKFGISQSLFDKLKDRFGK